MKVQVKFSVLNKEKWFDSGNSVQRNSKQKSF